MGQRAAQWVALIFLFTHLGASSTEAIGLCDCCGNGTALTPDCRSACATAREEIPMCRPAVLYDGDPGTTPGDNALAVGSLKFLGMGRPDRPALEHFRQWFELWRSRAEEKFQAALARYESRQGMRRYIEIVRAGGHRRVMMVLATAQSAKAAVPASVCTRNSVKAPCVVAEAESAPAAPRLGPRVVAPRREVHRSKSAARQKITQQKVVQQILVRGARKTAKVCTGNWVNAACAAP